MREKTGESIRGSGFLFNHCTEKKGSPTCVEEMDFHYLRKKKTPLWGSNFAS